MLLFSGFRGLGLANPLCRPIGLPDCRDSGLQIEDSECLGVPKRRCACATKSGSVAEIDMVWLCPRAQR